jgi:5-methylthioadenosine/S-adenosylhomocysteine deaminase
MIHLIRHVAVLPAEGPFIPRGFAVTDGDRIADLGPGEGPDPTTGLPDGRGFDVIVDAPGMVLVPGFINAHTHLSLTTYRGIADDVRLFDFLAETRKRWGRASPEEARQAALAGIRAAVRSGTTCLVDSVPTTPRPAAEAAREVGVRLLCGGAARSTWFGEPATDTFPAVLREGDAAARDLAGDDLLFIPYLAAHSPYNCTGQQIRQVKAACRERGWLFAIHLAECEEEVELIQRWHGRTPTAYLDSLGVLDDRTLLAHGVFLNDEDIRTVAARGSHVMHCPKSNAKLGDGIAPIPACLSAGVSVALGTDSMVSNNNLDMLEEMRFGALIHRAVTRDPSIVTAGQMFRMATINGARALGLAGELGSLRRGKKADMALLDLAPPVGLTEDGALSELVFHATAEAVRIVWVNGRIVFDRGGVSGSRNHRVEPQ